MTTVARDCSHDDKTRIAALATPKRYPTLVRCDRAALEGATPSSADTVPWPCRHPVATFPAAIVTPVGAGDGCPGRVAARAPATMGRA